MLMTHLDEEGGYRREREVKSPHLWATNYSETISVKFFHPGAGPEKDGRLPPGIEPWGTLAMSHDEARYLITALLMVTGVIKPDLFAQSWPYSFHSSTE